MDLDLTKSFIGVVEDNNDPKRNGRCRVRVLDIFDDIPKDDIPWASPERDLNGNGAFIPEVGKIVSVGFDNGNIYAPVYKYAQEYNINLRNKLESLSGEGYKTMRAILFDHKTQVFSNDDDSFMIDYKLNQMNIDNSSINLNLKNNGGSVNIGTDTANQQAILGNNFFDWFDTLVDELLGSNGGPYLGNMGAPVIPNPSLIQILIKYKVIKDPKFLSHNVNFNDNGQINKIKRPSDGQIGDAWKSTEKTNNITTDSNANFNNDRSLNSPNGQLTTSSDPNTPTPILSDSDIEAQEPPEGEVSPDIDKLIEVLEHKNYKVFKKPYEINSIGVRYQYEGDNYSDKFKDRLYAIWKDGSDKWKMKYWNISTIPGKSPGRSAEAKGFKTLKDYVGRDRGGLGIMVPAQYVDVFHMDYHRGTAREARAMKTKGKQLAYRDQNYGTPKITFSNEDPRNASGGANFAMYIHKAYSTGAGKNTYGVKNWSEGCQVFADPKCLNQYFDLCQKHKGKYGNSFTYTLITSKDVEEAEKRMK